MLNTTMFLFLNFARLLGKDEIKKGSFEISLGITQAFHADKVGMHASLVKISDTGAETNYEVNSPAGEYGILSVADQAGPDSLDGSVDHSSQKAMWSYLLPSRYCSYHYRYF